MVLGVCGVGGVKVLRLVTRLRDSQGLFGPIDGGICDAEPREFKDDALSATTHDIEEMFLGDPFNVCVEGTSIANCTSLVCSLVNIANSDGGGELLGGESVLSDKLPVNAGDICTRVN